MTDAPKQSLPKQDLASAFSRRPAAALPARPQVPAADAESAVPPVAPESTEQATAGPEKERSTPRRQAQSTKRAPRRQAADGGGEDATAAQVIYVPGDLRNRIGDHRKATGSTNALVVLDAIDSLVTPGAKDPLAQLRERVDASLVPQPSKSIFDREPKRAIKDAGAGAVQLSLRLSSRNWAILEDLVEQTGAASPTHLITVALTAYLDDRDE